MFTRKVHSAVAIFMMALLITAKLAAYHTLSHQDECVECCSFCESVMLTGQTPAVLADTQVYEQPVLPLPSGEEGNLSCIAQCYPGIPASSLFSRPPPVL